MPLQNAINLHDNSDLPALFFPPESILDDIDASSNDSEKTTSSSIVPSKKEKTPVPPPHRRIPVFYCEYSQKRGPTMWAHFLHFDRLMKSSPG